MWFNLKIWDKHYIQDFQDGEWVEIPHPTDDEWHKFTFGFDTDQIRIVGAKEHVIFSSDFTPQRCVKIYLSDEDHVIGRYSYEGFDKLYTEKYLPLIPKTLSDIVEDLEGGDG